MKRKKGNIKSLIEHIKAELLSSSSRPIEIRDDLFLDKLLAGQNEDDDPREDNFEKEADREKGLLWPPFYHGNNTWSYFWFIKNKKNLTKFVLENPDKFKNSEPLLVEDKYPIIHAIYRLLKRLARFVLWLIYVCVGGLWHLIYGYNKRGQNRCSNNDKIRNWIESFGLARGCRFKRLLKVVIFVFVILPITTLIVIIILIPAILPIMISGLVAIICIAVCYISVSLVNKVCRFLFKKSDEPKSAEINVFNNGNNVNPNWIERLIGSVNRKQIDASRWSGLNAIILSIVTVLFVCIIVNVVMFFVRDVIFFHPEMSINDAGVVKITQPCNVEHYLFLHSCVELWKDTGIDIVEGDKFEVNYSGAFYSTIRDMNNASLHHKEPRYRLMNSRNYGNNQKEDSIVKYCVYNAESARIGQLLFQIVPTGQEPKHQCGDDAIFAVDFSENKNENSTEAQRSGRLRVAVNDIYLPREGFSEMIKSKSINSKLKCELLNRALYPISMNQVFTDSVLDGKSREKVRKGVVLKLNPRKIQVADIEEADSLCDVILVENDSLRNKLKKVFNDALNNKDANIIVSGLCVSDIHKVDSIGKAFFAENYSLQNKYNLVLKYSQYKKDANIIADGFSHKVDSLSLAVFAESHHSYMKFHTFFLAIEGKVKTDSLLKVVSNNAAINKYHSILKAEIIDDKSDALKDGLTKAVSRIKVDPVKNDSILSFFDSVLDVCNKDKSMDVISEEEILKANNQLESVYGKNDSLRIMCESLLDSIRVRRNSDSQKVDDLLSFVFDLNDLIREQYGHIRDVARVGNEDSLSLANDTLFAQIELLNHYLGTEILQRIDSIDADLWNNPDFGCDGNAGFWYNDNAGDLLVNVTVYRDNHSLLSMSGPYRFIEHQFVNPDRHLRLVVIIVLVLLVLYVVDYFVGRYKS